MGEIRFNSYYVGIIQNLMSGADGEVVALLQYIYEKNILGLFNDELNSLLSEIISFKLSSVQSLGQMIVLLGGDPVYTSSKGVYLTGRNIDYIKDIKMIILQNIESEEKSILDMKLALSKIDETKIKSKIKEIIAKNQKNLEKLKIFYEKI